jgi:hypothetical protein
LLQSQRARGGVGRGGVGCELVVPGGLDCCCESAVAEELEGKGEAWGGCAAKGVGSGGEGGGLGVLAGLDCCEFGGGLEGGGGVWGGRE